MAKKSTKGKEDILSIIKTEYISDPKMSYRKLSEKYDYPLKKISAAGRKEDWVQLRKQTGDKILKKTINRISTRKADELTRVITTAGKVIRKLEKTMEEDDKQFNRHIVVEDFKPKEKVYKKLDTRAVKDVATALKELAAVVSLNNQEDAGSNIEVEFKNITEDLNE